MLSVGPDVRDSIRIGRNAKRYLPGHLSRLTFPIVLASRVDGENHRLTQHSPRPEGRREDGISARTPVLY